MAPDTTVVQKIHRFTMAGKILGILLVIVVLPRFTTLVASGHMLTAAASSPLPCVLLVDDDQDNPDVRFYYTSALDALDALGATFRVWDLAVQGDPSATDLQGYQMVIWFTGYPRNDTFTLANESAVAAYLDAGGRFLLSSEDYLHDRGLTSFGEVRLRIGDYASDVNLTDPEGTGSFPGGLLGPYELTPPDGWTGHLYTDAVFRDGG